MTEVRARARDIENRDKTCKYTIPLTKAERQETTNVILKNIVLNIYLTFVSLICFINYNDMVEDIMDNEIPVLQRKRKIRVVQNMKRRRKENGSVCFVIQTQQQRSVVIFLSKVTKR